MQKMHLSIVLPLRNHDQLTSLLSSLYDPSSSNYHHFLTVKEFTDQFGPTAEDYQKVVDFATSKGLTVRGAAANRMVVSLSGSVEQVENAFGMKMHRYQHPTEAREFHSPDREPSVPAGLPIRRVTGLSDYSVPMSMARRPQTGEKSVDVQGSGTGGYYLGSDMRAAYYGQGPLTGAGESVALVQFGGYDINDVTASFAGAAGATANGSNYLLSYSPDPGGAAHTIAINNVLLDGMTAGPGPDDGEEVLDIVQTISMAPGLNQVRVYIGQSDVDVLNAIASENAARQVSISWAWRPDDPELVDFLFQEMAAQGQTVFVASGDYGAYSIYQPFFFPAEDSYVTAVGGTTLTTNGAGGEWASETAWWQSGGGISPDSVPMPGWQRGVATVANQASSQFRNVPDVAMEADTDNFSCSLGQCQGGWGGTSFAAPRWAGYMALVNEAGAKQGLPPVGFFSPLVYSLAQSTEYTNAFNDITRGTNAYIGGVPYFYAVPGYDLVTGWGSPAGDRLVSLLNPTVSDGFQLSFSPSRLVIQPGSSDSTTITVNSAGSLVDPVTFSVDPLPAGITATFSPNPSSGTSVLTLAVAGDMPRGSLLVKVSGAANGQTAFGYVAVQINAPGFMLSGAKAVWISPGFANQLNVNLHALGDFHDPATLSVTSPLPPGVTAAFSSDPVTNSAVVTFIGDETSVPGNSIVHLTAQSPSASDTESIYLYNNPPVFDIRLEPPETQLVQGSSVSMTVVLLPVGNIQSAPIELSSAFALPDGVTVTFDPAEIHLGQTSTMTVSASPSGTIGSFYVGPQGYSASQEILSYFGYPMTIVAPPGQPSYSITPTSALLVLPPGGNVRDHLTVNDEYGFDQPVSFSQLATVLPPGVSLNIVPTDENGGADVTYTGSTNAAVGLWDVSAWATYGADSSHDAFALLTMLVEPTVWFTLGTPTAAVALNPGGSNSTPIAIAPANGYSGSVQLSASGLPESIQASFDSITTDTDTTLRLSADPLVPDGLYFVNVSGTANGQTQVRTIQVQVGQAGGPKIPAPNFNPDPGTYLQSGQLWITLSDDVPYAQIYYTLDGTTPTTRSNYYAGSFEISSTTTVKAIAVHDGFTTSDVSSAAYTIMQPVTAGPMFSPDPGTYTSAQTVTISDATPNAQIFYTIGGTTPTTGSTPYSGQITVAATKVLKAIAVAQGYSDSPVTTATYNINPPAATPTFSVAPGTYTSVQTVTMSDSTPGAVIYYTTNGSTPTTSSTPYSGPITISASETLQAIATASGYSPSAVASAVYTINLPAAAPTFSLTPGAYTSVQNVSISDSTPGAVIYYTTHGNTPTTSSSLYSGPITVSASETIQAIATATNYSQSAVASVAYTINLPAATPTFSIAPGTYTSVQNVAIDDSTPGAVIYYTTNRSMPTTGSTPYSGLITVSASETMQAIAIATNYSQSAVASAVYIINLANPVPTLTSISPGYVAAGNAGFTLTVGGTGFVPGSTIDWGSAGLTTNFVSATQLTAQVPGSTVAHAGKTSITVQNPAPGGGTSNALLFEVDSANNSTAPVFGSVSASVTAGSTASYSVTLPSTASAVTATCLNLPVGATCNYSASTGAVTIATLSTTPAGSYQITVVFSETLAGSASGFILMPFLLFFLSAHRRRLASRWLMLVSCSGILMLMLAAVTGCGGGGGGSTSTAPETHQVTSSATVTLTVK